MCDKARCHLCGTRATLQNSMGLCWPPTRRMLFLATCLETTRYREGKGGGHVSGTLTVKGDRAGLCNLGLDTRAVLRGGSATDFTAVNVTVLHDDVAIMIVGVAPRQNQIDVTGLAVSGVSSGGRNIVVAAAHAEASLPVTIECSPTGGTVLVQPYIADANVTGLRPGCTVVDLYSLLAIFGQPYEVCVAQTGDCEHLY